jgi:CRP-like cAMP-binding protein
MLKPIKTLELYQKPPSPETFAPGEVIFREGEEGHLMYGVISGEVEMYVDGKLVETIKPGDLFGEGAIVHEGHKRTSTAMAKTKTVLAFLDRKHFLFVVQETPIFAIEVMGSYSDRFRRLKNIFREL